MGLSQDSTHMTKIVPTRRRKLEVLEGHTHFLGDFWGPLDFGIMCMASCDNPIHIQWTPLLVNSQPLLISTPCFPFGNIIIKKSCGNVCTFWGERYREPYDLIKAKKERIFNEIDVPRTNVEKCFVEQVPRTSFLRCARLAGDFLPSFRGEFPSKR